MVSLSKRKKQSYSNNDAGDTTAALSDINSAHTLFKLLDDFKKLSGLALNPTETKGMWIGSLKETKTKPFGIKWPNEANKALGVSYSHDQNYCTKKIIKKVDSVKELISIWSTRSFCMGR